MFGGGFLFNHGYQMKFSVVVSCLTMVIRCSDLYSLVVVSCFTMVIRCSVLWWFPVRPRLSDVVFGGGFLFNHGYQM